MTRSENSEPEKKETPAIKSWFAESLIAVMLCMPLGLAGVYYAWKCRTLLAKEETDKAKRASARAKAWSIAGYAAFIIFVVLYYILLFILRLRFAPDSQSIF